MFLHHIDLTSALRPTLLPDETVLFVQDSVGLYEGREKIPQYQKGHAYLTSHRACYVGNEDPRKNSVAVDLKSVDRSDFYAGWMKSSPKVILIPIAAKAPLPARGQKPSVGPPSPIRQESPIRGSASPVPRANATWICPICSFSNSLPVNFDPRNANSRTYIPPCNACGITPPFLHIVKAALLANRQPNTQPPQERSVSVKKASLKCPRCTYDNDPYLLECEICQAPLAASPRPLDLETDQFRVSSPLPSAGKRNQSPNDEVGGVIKFSFRKGGADEFYKRLKNAMVQRKWLLQGAPPVPRPTDETSTPNSEAGSRRAVGIAGLEMRGQEQRKNNEQIIGGAFEDLEALMTSAKEIIALAESFSTQAREGNLDPETNALLSQSALALGMTTTTKDMLASDTVYISELSKSLAEFLTDDAKGILRKEGGIMSLVDVWAIFNRARNGVELVSPADFKSAAQLWDRLRLPIHLRRFKSGLLVVQGRDRTDEKIVAAILAWLAELCEERPPLQMMHEVTWDWRRFGRGVTVQETAARFGWSIGVATEELEMAEESGALCREQGLGGVLFWENWMVKL